VKNVALKLALVLAIGSLSMVAAQGPQRTGGGMPDAKPQLDTLKLPAGFTAEVYAIGVQGARSMALAPDGTIFVGTRAKSVYAVVDKDKDRKAETVLTIANGLNMPNGIAFKDGALYVAEVNRISRYDDVLDAVKSGNVTGLTPKVVLEGLPSDWMHGWKYIAFGPDGYLYYQIGAPCNVCDKGDPYAAIWRVKPEGGTPEIVARGVRNTVGMAWHPDTKALWFTDNGRDMLGDESPNDELNVAPKLGLHFGYPYCHQGDTPDPNTDKNNSIDTAANPCSKFAAPAQRLGPHVAALALKFYGGTMFPSEYRKKLFIVNHGSWNRTPGAGPIGYRLMVATVDGDKVTKYEPFAEGFLQGKQAWGRPVDLLEMPDGSLLVSDDTSGAIYRISYKK
jgi:glucose/arabinose dehydrogenase